MQTRAVLFDLGNTLVDYYRAGEFRPILRQCLQSVSNALGVAPEPEPLLAHAWDLNREAPDLRVRPLAARLAELYPQSFASGPVDPDRICRAFMAPIFACARARRDAVPVLEALRARGQKTAIVSNTPWGSPAELWREELGRHALLQRVDAAIFCVDVGWRKPHPAPFRRALEVLGVAASDAIFVGDDPRWDVEGAQRAGLRPVLLCASGEQRAGCAVLRDLHEVVQHAALEVTG